MEQRMIGEVFSGEGSGWPSDSQVQEEAESFEESPPLPFPHRNGDFNVHSPRRELFRESDNQGFPSAANDIGSCFIVVITFCFFGAMTLLFGVYGPENMILGPNSSMLMNQNHLLVESMKAVAELESSQGLTMYGFYKTPPLDVAITWSENHKVTLPYDTHKEWNFFLNKGSLIDMSYSINSSSLYSLILVVAEGKEGLNAWLDDPSYANTTLSWNIIRGNGSVQKKISKASSYYIGVGNVDFELVELKLEIRIKALLYNTTEAYYQCTLLQGQCSFKLSFSSENVALITSPSRNPGMGNGAWHVQISYGPRWLTYVVGVGGFTLLVLLINHISNHLKKTNHGMDRDQSGVRGSETNPLLSQKYDAHSSRDSSCVSISEEENYFGNSQVVHCHDTEPGNDGECTNTKRLCAICFDAPRDSFFLPCGHCVACFGCSKRIAEDSGSCPICRRKIKKVRKIYTA